jgi:hypothetical protein
LVDVKPSESMTMTAAICPRSSFEIDFR